MKTFKTIRKAMAAALMLGGILSSNVSQAATPYVMSTGNYSLDFADIANWANNFTAGIGAANWGSVPVQAGTIGDGVKTTVSTATFATGSSGGVQKGTGNIVLLSTSTANACAIDLYLDFTGRNAGTVSFDVASINNSVGDRESILQLFYTTDGTTFTELTGTSLPYTATNNYLSSAHISVSLPSALNGISTARLRLYERSTTLTVAGANGSQPKISIDNVAVTSTGASGSPPVITGITPSSATVNAGSTVQYVVTATGDAASYFWYKETPSATNLISGANTAILTLTNVLAASTANYQVVLTNASGAATSAVVSLTVIDPAILTQPASAIRLLAGSATFSVAASGTPTLSYQWYFKPTSDNVDFTGATALSNVGAVSGAQTATLTITNLSYANATNLYVVVTSGAGSVTSSVVTLSVASSVSLAYWNFNGFLNVTSPATYLGVGTATALNCVGFSNNITSGLDYDFTTTPPNAWGTSTYPAAGVSNKTAGVRFTASTLGAKNINVSFDTRASATASKYQRLQYTTNGTDYIDFPASSQFGSLNYESRSNNLSGFPGVNNNPNFGVRIVSEFQSTAQYGMSTNAQYVGNPSTYAGSGTVSFDIVNITGDAITNANTLPTISSFTNVVTTDTNSAVVLGFTVGDAETAAADLTVEVTSYDQAVMPAYQMSLGGSGASRTLSLASFGNQVGVAPILVKVTDGSNDVSATWFYVTVNPGNYPPTISGLMNTNTLGNTTNYYSFTVADDLTAVGSLTAAAYSGNATLVPNDAGHVLVTGSGSSRTVMVAPLANQYGTAPIYVTANDGFKSSTNVFYLIVRPNTVTLADEAFDYDVSGPIITQSAGLWSTHSGTAGQMQVGSGVVTVTDVNSEDVNAPLLNGPYTASSAPVLYSSFTLNYSTLPVATNSYFAHFITGSSTFYGRVYASTALAASGKYRIGIASGSATPTSSQLAVDLSPGVNYTIVTRLVLSNSVSTIWINPTSESDPSVTDASTSSAATVTGYAIRESSQGTLTMDNLKVGKNFLTVVSNIVDVPPLANADGYTVQAKSTNNVFSPLTNDVLNLAVGTLSLASVSATNGTATISGTNVLFTPAPNFAGTATIGYTITDGFGGLSTSLITVTVVAPAPIPLNAQLSGGSFILSWTNAVFGLQSSTNVAGPYADVSGASSPYTNNLAVPAMFFRLKF